MYKKPDPETEKKIIENLANSIVNSSLSVPTTLFLSSFKSLSWISGVYATVLIEPFLPIYELEGSNLIKTFEKIENVESLIERINELEKEKEEKKVQKKSKIKNTNWYDRFIEHIKKIIKK